MKGQWMGKFDALNNLSTKGGAVFVGSDFFAGLPFAELAKSFHIEENIHNRSLKGTTVADVCDNLDEFIFAIAPNKIFINLGDAEANEGMDVDEFIQSFEWMLCSIHNKCDADIYVVSLAAKSELHERYNIALKKLCAESGCRFIDATASFNGATPEVDVFKSLRLYIHGNLDFTEMMLML